MTLDQYEISMNDPEGFRNPKEKEIASKIVVDLRNQISKIDRLRKGNETEMDLRSMIKSISTSVEDRRIRGMRELFAFYSQQHQSQGQEFGAIENK